MPIKMTTDVNIVDLYLKECTRILMEEINRGLYILGEKCVTKVRDRSYESSWIDHTGNLRSSIGYSVYNHGKKVIESAFNIVKGGKEGAEAGRKMVEDLASQYAQTYALVILAGMNYAEQVEKIETKDVLASTELWAKKEIDGIIEKSVGRAKKRIEKEL